MFYLTTHSTCGYNVGEVSYIIKLKGEGPWPIGRKEMFIYCYMASDMVKNHSF